MPSGIASAGRSATASSPSRSRMSSTASSSPRPGRSPNPVRSRADTEQSLASFSHPTGEHEVLADGELGEQLHPLERAGADPSRARVLRAPAGHVDARPSRTRPPSAGADPTARRRAWSCPAPLGPTSPTVDPSGTVRLTSSSATTPPKRTVTSSRGQQRRVLHARFDGAHAGAPATAASAASSSASSRSSACLYWRSRCRLTMS